MVARKGRSSLDDEGYLVSDSFECFIEPGGAAMTKAFVLASLWSYGEDEVAGAVRAGLPVATVEAMAQRLCETRFDLDPRTGRPQPADRRMASAAVEIVEGGARPLARQRRRSSA